MPRSPRTPLRVVLHFGKLVSRRQRPTPRTARAIYRRDASLGQALSSWTYQPTSTSWGRLRVKTASGCNELISFVLISLLFGGRPLHTVRIWSNFAFLRGYGALDKKPSRCAPRCVKCAPRLLYCILLTEHSQDARNSVGSSKWKPKRHGEDHV